MAGAVIGGIWLVFNTQKFWDKAKVCSDIEFADWIGLAVLSCMAVVSLFEFILTLVYTVNARKKCKIDTGRVAVVGCYGFASSILLCIIVVFFGRKTKWRRKSTNRRSEKIILSVLIFATLSLGLQKFVDHCSVAGIPYAKVSPNSTCDKDQKRYLETETYLRPVIIQFCVFSVFLLVKIIFEDKNDQDGLLPLSKSTSSDVGVKVEHKDAYLNFMRPHYHWFIGIVGISCLLVLSIWIAPLAVAERSGNADLYARASTASFSFSAVFCFLLLRILKYYCKFEKKETGDAFASASIVITSSLLLILHLLSARANYICYTDRDSQECKKNMTADDVSPKLQVIYRSFGILEIGLQTVVVLTVRRLKHDYWLPIVEKNSNEYSFMPAADDGCFPVRLYPFLVMYLSLMNLVRYAVDLALEGPILEDLSQKSATAFLAESFIYGKHTWIFIDNVLYSLGSLFRLISFFSFLQLAMKVMFNTFSFWHKFKNPQNQN